MDMMRQYIYSATSWDILTSPPPNMEAFFCLDWMKKGKISFFITFCRNLSTNRVILGIVIIEPVVNYHRTD